MRVDSPVYRAAATMIHRKAGSATTPILIGAISEVSQIAIALMITMNSPRVEYRSRPVSATRTGRAKRLTSTRIAAQLRKPMGPAPRRPTMGTSPFPPNGNGWATEIAPRRSTMNASRIASSTTSTMKRRI